MGYALTNVSVVLEIETCCTCGMHFAMPDTLRRSALRDNSIYFYCPMGHPQHFSKGEADRLREKLDEQTREATRQAARAAHAQQERDAEAALRAKAERRLKRVARGTCPDCNRTFQNLARHMACKHAPKPE